MTKLEFGQLIVPAIAARWPQYAEKFDEGQQKVHYEYLRFFDANDVIAALGDHHREEPDKRQPLWKTVHRLIRENRSKGHGSNRFEILLENVKQALLKARVARATDMTPEELFQNHLDANTFPIVREMDGRPRDDPDGSRAKMAQQVRRNMAMYWANYLSRRGAPVPEWLQPQLGEWVAPGEPRTPSDTIKAAVENPETMRTVGDKEELF